MGKNMKKVLSYALGIILAMGIGLTYAYAVGANDSNAFVTTTEWQAKVDKIQASIDNVRKTINDSNMDFVMNSPRLQVTTIDGLQTPALDDSGNFYPYWPYQSISVTDIGVLYSRINYLSLLDLWDGKQSVVKYSMSNGNFSYTQGYCAARFALKTNEPDIYLIVSLYSGSYASTTYAIFCYINVGDEPLQSLYTSARTLTVTLPYDEWWCMRTTNVPASIGRSSTNVFSGTLSNGYQYPERISLTNSNFVGYFSNPGTGYVTKTANANDITYTFEFPATCCTLAVYARDFWDTLPIDMSTRKFGSHHDQVTFMNSSSYRIPTAKVYSPQKGCLALKSNLNGEIPILNE